MNKAQILRKHTFINLNCLCVHVWKKMCPDLANNSAQQPSVPRNNVTKVRPFLERESGDAPLAWVSVTYPNTHTPTESRMKAWTSITLFLYSSVRFHVLWVFMVAPTILCSTCFLLKSFQVTMNHFMPRHHKDTKQAAIWNISLLPKLYF